MSGWLESERKKTVSNTEAKKNDLDEVSNIMYLFNTSISRIESLSKAVDTPSDNTALRTKLRKAREKAKKEARTLSSKLEGAKDYGKDDEFNKLLKQYKEINDRFQRVYKDSQEKEKNSMRGQQGITFLFSRY